MTINEFILEFKDFIQTEDDITINTVLADLTEWDSMSIMTCVAWFDTKLGIKLTYNDFLPLKDLKDIIALSQGKIAG